MGKVEGGGKGEEGGDRGWGVRIYLDEGVGRVGMYVGFNLEYSPRYSFLNLDFFFFIDYFIYNG